MRFGTHLAESGLSNPSLEGCLKESKSDHLQVGDAFPTSCFRLRIPPECLGDKFEDSFLALL